VNFDDPLDLGRIEATRIFDVLYEIFHDDFIRNKTFLNKNIFIDPQSNKKEDGKELSFWHLTTRKQRYYKKDGNRTVKMEERLTDYDRAARIHWIKPIIENGLTAQNIKLFYKKETTGKKPIRLYLWAYDEDFVVILQKLGKSSSFLVTSFYITHQHKRADFQKSYEKYVSHKDPNLRGCEWF